MFYRLKSDYILRGWEGMPWVLVKRPENKTRILKREVGQALLLCDGQTDLSGILSDPAIASAIQECKTDGYIESLAEMKPLEPDQCYRYYENRYVRRVFWSVTGRCNYRCRHCYMDAPDAALGELSTQEALNLIDQISECGILQVDITGGEPFIRKDFWQLIDRIVSYRMTIGIVYTNGWLLNDAMLDEFESRGLKPEFAISFDGVGWHDWMRGVPGAEEAALRALQLCYRRGFIAGATMCVHRGNLNTIPQTVKAVRKIGIDELLLSNVDMTSLWCSHSEGNAMTLREYTEAMLPYIYWYYEAGRPIGHLKIGGVADLWRDAPGQICVKHYDGTKDCLDGYLCGSTRWSCYITPEGRMLPCMPMTASPDQSKFPRVQDIGLQKGLSNSYYMQFVNSRVKDLLAVNQECAACNYRYKCGGGCRAAALLGADHNLMGCDRNMCLLWKNGYVERIQQAIDDAEAKYGAPVTV